MRVAKLRYHNQIRVYFGDKLQPHPSLVPAYNLTMWGIRLHRRQAASRQKNRLYDISLVTSCLVPLVLEGSRYLIYYIRYCGAAFWLHCPLRSTFSVSKTKLSSLRHVPQTMSAPLNPTFGKEMRANGLPTSIQDVSTEKTTRQKMESGEPCQCCPRRDARYPLIVLLTSVLPTPRFSNGRRVTA